MGIFDRFFGRVTDEAAPDSPLLPWNHAPSIYEFLRAHIDPKQPGLPWAALQLPDQERYDQKWESPPTPDVLRIKVESPLATEAEEESIGKVV